MKKEMYYGASNLIFEKAKELRKQPTHSEMLMWSYLRLKPLGYKFRRQHPISMYVADFYCHSLKLIIEIDGGIHCEIEVFRRDIERQKNLESDGINFLRFTNEQVEKQFEKVIAIIENYIHHHLK